jgi:selenocysteine lyase/cysteine desulfurase
MTVASRYRKLRWAKMVGMTSPNPTADLETLAARYRDEFPVTKQLIYLNHAAVAPLSRRTAAAMKNLSDDVMDFGSLHYDRWMECYAGLRGAAAKLIGAAPEEIAIVKNTSEGIATVAFGLNWKGGDRVVAFQEEFPANYHPWARLQSRGVEITWLSIYDPIEKIAAAIPGAKLLAISFVNYLSGYRADLQAIGDLCHRHGCFFFVDAIQGLGVFPLDVNALHIDALSSDGHKWLLGPEGNGILYVRRERQDAIEPVEFGWTNTAHYADYASRDMTLRPDAGRYECGTLNTVGCFGLRTAIELILEIGVSEIGAAVSALAGRVESGVHAEGYEVMKPRSAATGSGIVSFRHPTIDSRVIVSELKRHNILAAPRQGWVRVAPHFYLSGEEMDRVVECLPDV